MGRVSLFLGEESMDKGKFHVIKRFDFTKNSNNSRDFAILFYFEILS
jgi:hypothetical protein